MNNRHSQKFCGTLNLALSGSRENDWYIAFSRDDNRCAEGSWGDWVGLAKEILATDRMRKSVTAGCVDFRTADVNGKAD